VAKRGFLCVKGSAFVTVHSHCSCSNEQNSLHCCRYRTVVGVHGGDRLGHSKLRERPFIIGRQPSSYI
jgi:hypothetical protein